MIGIAITIYNRPAYVARMFDYFQHSDFSELKVMICLIDDNSDHPETIRLIEQFHIDGIATIKIKNRQNQGVFKSLKTAWDMLVSDGCSLLCNLDSDTIMKASWLKTLLSIYQKSATENDRVVTGYNSYCHPIIRKKGSYGIKNTLGGINLFFDTAIYNSLVSTCDTQYWDDLLCEKAQKNNVTLITALPSVIQHIGVFGLNCHPQYTDVAHDFI